MSFARALLQTSLLLWMVHQSVQGGLRPQTVAYGRMLPNRGVGLGVGVKPGVAGALGAVGNRYNTKAMKNGLGRFPGAQLGVGGYRSLGAGGRAGLKPGYGQGGYGASLGTGMLGPGLTNGLGLGLGQTGKRVYGPGLGTGLGAAGLGTGLGTGLGAGLGAGLGTGLGALPGGYGALGGLGIPGARQGPDLGAHGAHGAIKGPAIGRNQSPYVLNPVRSNIQHPSTLEIQAELSRATNRGVDKPSKSLGLAGQGDDYLRGGQGLSNARLLTHPSLERDIRNLPLQQNIGVDKPGKSLGLMGGGGEDYLRGAGQGLSNTQLRTYPGLERDLRNLPLQQNIGVDKPGKSLGLVGQGGEDYLGGVTAGQGLSNARFLTHPDLRTLPLQQHTRDIPTIPNQKAGKNCNKGLNDQLGIIQQSETLRSQGLGAQFPIDKSAKYQMQTPGESAPSFQQQQFPLPEGVFSMSRGGEGPISELGLVGKSTDKLQAPQTRISIGIESGHGGSNLRTQGAEGNRQGPGAGLVGGAEVGASASLGLGLAEEQKSIGKEGKNPFHEGRDVREPKALPGTADNAQGPSYLGGQGGYLGASLGAGGYGTGLGQGGYLGGAAGKLAAGYGDGMTGYLGALGSNGYGGALTPGYTNGFGEGYGTALGTGAFPGQLPGAGYGLGAGLETVNGKYGGGSQLPYGGAPVIPAGLEGEGGYPYTQPLGLEAESAKAAKSYGDPAAKFPGGAAPLVNGYKG